MKKRPRKLLDQVRDAIRLKHYSIRTELANGDFKVLAWTTVIALALQYISRLKREAEL